MGLDKFNKGSSEMDNFLNQVKKQLSAQESSDINEISSFIDSLERDVLDSNKKLDIDDIILKTSEKYDISQTKEEFKREVLERMNTLQDEVAKIKEYKEGALNQENNLENIDPSVVKEVSNIQRTKYESEMVDLVDKTWISKIKIFFDALEQIVRELLTSFKK